MLRADGALASGERASASSLPPSRRNVGNLTSSSSSSRLQQARGGRKGENAAASSKNDPNNYYLQLMRKYLQLREDHFAGDRFMPFLCPCCDTMFRSKDALLQHASDMPTAGLSSSGCSCPRCYAVKLSLQDDADAWPCCFVCNRVEETAAGLEWHLTTFDCQVHRTLPRELRDQIYKQCSFFAADYYDAMKGLEPSSAVESDMESLLEWCANENRGYDELTPLTAAAPTAPSRAAENGNEHKKKVVSELPPSCAAEHGNEGGNASKSPPSKHQKQRARKKSRKGKRKTRKTFSQYHGVSGVEGGIWEATCTNGDGKIEVLGLFEHEVDAAHAHDDRAREVMAQSNKKPRLNFTLPPVAYLCYCDHAPFSTQTQLEKHERTCPMAITSQVRDTLGELLQHLYPIPRQPKKARTTKKKNSCRPEEMEIWEELTPTGLMKRGLLMKHFCPPGWNRVYVPRMSTSTNKRGDVYYFPPKGKKLRSMPEVMRWHLEQGEHFDAEKFSYRENIWMRSEARSALASPSALASSSTSSSASSSSVPTLRCRTPQEYQMPKSSAILTRFESEYCVLHSDFANGKESFPIPILGFSSKYKHAQSVEEYKGLRATFTYDPSYRCTHEIELVYGSGAVLPCNCKDNCCGALDHSHIPCCSDGSLDPSGYLRPSLPCDTVLLLCRCKCGCDEHCPNRFADRGVQLPLYIVPTNGKGWGVRCRQPIRRGTFITEYFGEVISDARAEARRGKDMYLLDVFLSRKNSGLEDGDVVFDPYEYGGIARFFNHSCSPNMHKANMTNGAHVHVQAPQGGTFVTIFYRLGFFAARDISAGEELTWDYGYKPSDTANHLGELECKCGSANCRGRLL